ncbi:CPBP family intramembrane glutamic endopeptidase, partial [Longimicrobium sp.]|uniref:CPBP family intramembrane glutamic endopeptidase n=1 Tax=Longimicrobium sp. TaxID=2029185 RepID=UPI003B3A6BD8
MHPRDGRPVRALALYLLAVFAGGALLAPWLYHGIQALAPSIPALETAARMPFARYVNRGLLIVALLGLPFFVRAAGVRRWSDVGIPPGFIRPRRFAAAFALGFVSLAAVCAITLIAGGRLVKPRTPGELAGQFLGVLATALIVAVIEELLFRGAMFGTLRRAMRWPAALAASSGVYAITHFMHRGETPQTVDWLSGLRVLPTMLAGMTDVRTMFPALLSLALAGVILGLAYQWTGDLSASIGIHAGWIFWLKFYGFMTRRAPDADPWFWGTGKLVDGWLAFAALVVVLSLLVMAARRRGVHAEAAAGAPPPVPGAPPRAGAAHPPPPG